MNKTAARVWTIGYQGQELDTFLTTLGDAGVTMLVDVRRRASSHKKGFSKTPLSTALGEAGIGYEHLRELGMFDDLMPKRNMRDHSEILTKYRKRLEADLSRLDELRGLVAEERVCLLCFEADYRMCHRSVLADLLGAETVNL